MSLDEIVTTAGKRGPELSTTSNMRVYCWAIGKTTILSDQMICPACGANCKPPPQDAKRVSTVIHRVIEGDLCEAFVRCSKLEDEEEIGVTLPGDSHGHPCAMPYGHDGKCSVHVDHISGIQYARPVKSEFERLAASNPAMLATMVGNINTDEVRKTLIREVLKSVGRTSQPSVP